MSTTNGKNRIADSGAESSDSTIPPVADNVAKARQRHVVKVSSEGERVALNILQAEVLRAQSALATVYRAFCPVEGAEYKASTGEWTVPLA